MFGLVPLTATLGLLFSIQAGNQESAKLPPPDPAAAKEALKLIKDIFKDEYNKSRPEDRKILSRKLLQQATESRDDAVSRYVLLKEAQDLALQAGDLTTSLEAIQSMVQVYQVDGLALKAQTIAAIEKAVRSPTDLKPIASAYTGLCEEAVREDRFDIAEKAIQACSAIAKKTKDMPLLTRSDAMSKEIAALKQKSERVKKARETLAVKPDDPGANLLVGQFECFSIGNWEAGLPLLSKGQDAALKSLAEMDLTNSLEPSDQTAVADGWWTLSEKEAGTARENLRNRAVSWYEKASPRLSGLVKAKADKRVSEVRQGRLMKGSWVDITDPAVYSRIAKKGEALVLEATADTQTSSEIDKLPGSVDYDGVSVRIKFIGAPRGQARVRFEGQKRLVWINGAGPRFTAISRPPTSDWVTDFDTTLPLTEEYVVTLLLANGEWVAYVNGNELTRQRTTAKSLQTLGLIAFQNHVAFDRILLRKKE